MCFSSLFFFFFPHSSQFICDSGQGHNQSVLQPQDQVSSPAGGWWQIFKYLWGEYQDWESMLMTYIHM